MIDDLISMALGKTRPRAQNEQVTPIGLLTWEVVSLYILSLIDTQE